LASQIDRSKLKWQWLALARTTRTVTEIEALVVRLVTEIAMGLQPHRRGTLESETPARAQYDRSDPENALH
jgi:hypothetical protein